MILTRIIINSWISILVTYIIFDLLITKYLNSQDEIWTVIK